jgi:hypothetical protein
MSGQLIHNKYIYEVKSWLNSRNDYYHFIQIFFNMSHIQNVKITKDYDFTMG